MLFDVAQILIMFITPIDDFNSFGFTILLIFIYLIHVNYLSNYIGHF